MTFVVNDHPADRPHRIAAGRRHSAAGARLTLGLGLASVLLAAWQPEAAEAQILDQYFPVNVPGYDPFSLGSVAARPRPEYDPLGVRVGSFVLLPQLSEGLGYDNNILATKNGRLSSFLVNTRGSVQANSDWSRDSLGANITVNDVRYPQQDTQSYTNVTASVGGSLDIGRDKATLAYSHFSLHQLPSDIDNVGITEPIPFQVDTVRSGYRTEFGRISVSPYFDFTSYRFDNVTTASGTVQNEEVNNRNNYSGGVTTGYEFSQNRRALLVVQSGTNQYATPTASTPNDAGFSILAGLDYTADAVFRYRFLVGYGYRSYSTYSSTPLITSRSAPIAEASAIWAPTGLTTITATLSRRIEDSLTAGVVGYTYTQARVVVDHEYRRDILLEGVANYQYAEYTNTSDPQTIATFGGNVQWLLNRNARVVASNYFSLGKSTGNTTGQYNLSGSYTRNIALLSLHLAL